MAELATLYTISPSEESTVAIEVLGSGLIGRKKRHTLLFKNFRGEMQLVGKDPVGSRILLTVDASSVFCRDARMNGKKRQVVAEFARNKALAANVHPEIRFTSTKVEAKALRGFLVTGILQIHGTSRELKINMSFDGTRTRELQLDGDAQLRLSDFDLPRPSALFGLMGTRDEAVVHLRLSAVPAPST